MKGFKNRIGLVHLLDPQDIGATGTASSWLDTTAFNSASLVVTFGSASGASSAVYATPVLQEADVTTAASATAVAAGSMIGSYTAVTSAATDQCSQIVDYIGSKRYVRVNIDVTGALATCNVGVEGVLGRPTVLPAVAPAAVAAT